MQRTLFLIKPSPGSPFPVLQHLQQDLERSSWWDDKDPPWMVHARSVRLQEPDVEWFYGHAKEKVGERWPEMVKYLTSGLCLATVWRGEKIVEAVRHILGPTMVRAAHPSTIRGLYGKLADGRLLGLPHENIAHASDSIEAAEAELWWLFDRCGYEIGTNPMLRCGSCKRTTGLNQATSTMPGRRCALPNTALAGSCDGVLDFSHKLAVR